jgi:hypothetical protein
VAETVLEEANRLIYGPRQDAYGMPEDNHARIAALWNGYLEARYGYETPFIGLDAMDCIRMMALLKLARQIYKPSRDNLVDMCGYAALEQKALDQRDVDPQPYLDVDRFPG